MGDIAPPEMVEHDGDTFQTVMAVLIAVVTIVGALVAWRTAVISERAGNSDFASTSAVINTEESLTVGTARLYRNYRAYTDFVLNQQLATLLERDRANASPEEAALLELQALQARDESLSNREFFETRFLNLDGTYNTDRDLGESLADARRARDLDPAPHIATAIESRAQIRQLVGIFIVLSVALLFYSLAEAIHPTRRVLRYSCAIIASLCLTYSVVAALMVEFGGRI
ncbi:MAG: hypothetical protein AAF787_12145 [Chloroflexota bacterium]